MTMFYLLAGVLLILTVVFLLPALRNKRQLVVGDVQSENSLVAQQRIEELRSQNLENESDAQILNFETEVQAELLDDISKADTIPSTFLSLKSGLIVVALVPLVAVTVYGMLGNSQFAINDLKQLSANNQQHENLEITDLLAQLEARIAENPDNPKGWELAANTYMSMQNYDKAEYAYSRLNQLVIGNADHLTSWADATIMANDNTYTPQAKSYIEQALKLNPDHINALWIAALGAGSEAQYQQAIEHLTRLRKRILLNEDSESLAQIDNLIQFNREKLANAGSGPEQSAPERMIQVSVKMDRTLDINSTQFNAVYVFAKAESGPAVPLAVSKHDVNQLPFSTQLTSQMAMLPEFSLSEFNLVVISARLSKSGNAIAEAGDYVSDSIIVDFSSDPNSNPEPVELIINSPFQPSSSLGQ